MRALIDRTSGFRILAFSCVLLSALGSSACTPWPRHGTGGLAEQYPTASPRIVALEYRFAELVKLGGDRFMPAMMDEVRGLLTRARREFAGGLLRDADHTMHEAERYMAEVEFRLRRGRNRYG